MSSRRVSEVAQVFDQTIGRDLARLWESVHAFADFDENESIVDEVGQLVLIHDTFRDGPYWDSHVLVAFHRRIEVEVGDVEAMKCSAWGRDCAIHDQFCCCHVGRRGADFVWVIDEVASHSHSYAVWFGLLRADIDHDANIRGSSSGR